MAVNQIIKSFRHVPVFSISGKYTLEMPCILNFWLTEPCDVLCIRREEQN